LTTLEFKNCRFSGPALATVGLPNTIEDLRLRNQDVELSTVDRIFKLPINSLVFDDCKFSNAALNKVLSSAKLGSLEFAKTELDSGAFERLEKMKTLRSLKLSGCKFPFRAYKQFAKERPEVYVEFTTTAFLGVRSVPGESTCLISDVVPDSAAEVAGVQPDDLIVKVNGDEIGEFNDLRAHIALHQAGDQLELEILRNGAVVKLTVKLGDYADAPPR
jgi:predicted metalloprotease with PDZ domain